MVESIPVDQFWKSGGKRNLELETLLAIASRNLNSIDKDAIKILLNKGLVEKVFVSVENSNETSPNFFSYILTKEGERLHDDIVTTYNKSSLAKG